MTFDLPPTGPENPPAFLTVVACQDWLATVPLANPGHAQTMFLRQLNLLFRHEMPVVLRFELLETAGTVEFVAGRIAARARSSSRRHSPDGIASSAARSVARSFSGSGVSVRRA